MRRFATILLLGSLLFNLFGYGVLNGLLQESASRRLDDRLDRGQFDETALISIKAPVTDLAYYNNFIGFERVNGTIEINGVPCQYVERRIFNDSLELLCIPNETVLKLRSQHGGPHHPIMARSFSVDPYTYPGRFATINRRFIPIDRDFNYFLYFPFHPLLPDERPPLSGEVA